MTSFMTRRLLKSCFMLLSLIVLSACSRQQLYDTAIDYERDSADLTEHTMVVDGHKVAYLSNEARQGAQTIVMLHGFSANKDNWVLMARELTDTYNIYAIDLPGHGDSNQDIDRAYGFRDQVSYVHNILGAMKVENFNLIGNSMGGAISALYAATYPEQVSTLTLLDSAGVQKYDSELFDRVKAGENPLIVSKPGDYEKLVDFVMEKKPFVPWPIYSVLEKKAIARQAINKKIFADILASDEDRFLKALTTISAPTLIVSGREDRLINYRNTEVFEAQIPKAHTVILDGIGHVPMLEAPEKTAEMINNLLDGKLFASRDTGKAQ